MIVVEYIGIAIGFYSALLVGIGVAIGIYIASTIGKNINIKN